MLMTDFLAGRIKLTILSLLLTLSAFLLYDLVTTLMNEQTYEYRRYVNMYKSELGDVYKIDFQYINVGQLPAALSDRSVYEDFLSDLGSIEGVDSVGGYFYNTFRLTELRGSEEYSRIMDARRVGETDLPIAEGDSMVLLLDDPCLNFLKLASDDSAYEDFRESNDEYWPVLVGNAFKGILKVGDVLHYWDQKCKVVGFLKEGAVWPNTNGLGMYFYKGQSLDHHFVFRASDVRSFQFTPMVNSLYLSVNSSADKMKIEQDIRSIGNTYGCLLSPIEVKRILDESSADQRKAEKMYGKLLIMMIGICILTTGAASVISVMVQRRKIGIWYANGILPSDIRIMIIMEQLIKLMIPASLAYSIGAWYAGRSSDVYRMVHRTTTFRELLVLLGVTFIVSVAVPLIVIGRQQITDLLKVKE